MKEIHIYEYLVTVDIRLSVEDIAAVDIAGCTDKAWHCALVDKINNYLD